TPGARLRACRAHHRVGRSRASSRYRAVLSSVGRADDLLAHPRRRPDGERGGVAGYRARGRAPPAGFAGEHGAIVTALTMRVVGLAQPWGIISPCWRALRQVLGEYGVSGPKARGPSARPRRNDTGWGV